MIKKLLIVFALFFALAAALNPNAPDSADEKNVDHRRRPHGCKEVCAPSGRKFVLLSNPLCREEARKACCDLGGKLADLCDGPDYCFLFKQICVKSWINSWNGFDKAPLALYPDGAVAVPVGGAQSRQGAICECH